MRRAFASLFFVFCSTLVAQELPLKTVELEWEKVDNAFGYEVRLTPKAGGKPLTFRVIENRLAEEVPVGVYILRIRSKHRDVADRWSPWSDPLYLEVLIKELMLLTPTDDAVLTAQTDGREEVTFTWSKIEKARDYVLKIWTEETKEKPLTFVTRKNSQRLKLLPGRVYFWQVTFESATQVSYAQEARSFKFSLQGQKLLQPSITPVEPLTEIKRMAWLKSPKAKTYHARLFFRHLDETDWKPIKEANLVPLNWAMEKLKAGQYKLEVVAKAPRYADSDPGIYEFTVKPTEAEMNQALSQL